MAASTLFLAVLVFKAVAVVQLVRIAVTDFRIQKIFNDQLLQLLAVALCLQLIDYMQTGSVFPLAMALAAAAAIFAILLIFWLAGKIGAGDVKLLALAPLLVGQEGSLSFLVALLAFTIATHLVMKFPVMLPERWFRSYVQSLAVSGRVPFGVPISAAAVISLLLSSSA